MEMQVLTPGMQHGKKTNVGAEQSGVAGGFKQRGCGSAEQDRVDLFRVLERQPADLGGQREHDMEIGNRQKLGLALRQPPGASRSLALGTVPIPTRVIQDDAMSAPIALLHAPAEGGRTAVAKVTQGFSLLARKHGVPARQELVVMSADNVGHLRPMRGHRCGNLRSSESSGLGVERTATSATCRERAVVSRLAWPSRIWMVRRLIPA